MAMETTVRSLMAIPILMDSIAKSNSPEGLWSATYTDNSSQGTFTNIGCKSNRNELLSPNGNFEVKRPAFLEGLLEKSFCSTKQVSLFLHS